LWREVESAEGPPLTGAIVVLASDETRFIVSSDLVVFDLSSDEVKLILE
jgi:hypothetical protein